MKLNNLPMDFNYKIYLLLNDDLKAIYKNEIETKNHYEKFGYKENRKYKFENVPINFNYKLYLKLNTDIELKNEIETKNHYEKFGYKENRKYSISINEKYKLNPLLNNFLDTYSLTYEELINNPKNEFRFICYNGIGKLKDITLPNFKISSEYEAVLIEYRCFPHLEFIIRNNILKLGENWSHTVVCGNLNYNFIKKICNKISININIINSKIDNLIQSEYSKFLASEKFWNLLKGKKILIYQEDSIIFKRNINDFLDWDYIGAPWNIEQNDNKMSVGNGGISIRTKKIMIDIIKKIKIEDTILNSDTINYMKNTNLYIAPEDVYFTKNMEDFNIGKLADRESATNFSSESIFNKDCFCGHNFWVGTPEWKQMIYHNNIIKFKPNYDMSFLEHRGGWKTTIEFLLKNKFYSNHSNYDFFDMVENHFLWNTNTICTNKWSGIIHCTNNTPEYLKIIDIENLFNNNNFIESLKNCGIIFTLASNVSDYLKNKINNELKLNIPIKNLKLPVVNKNIPLFNLKKYLLNKNKNIIQIGQQLRKVSSIYLINTPNFKKIWLTGTKNFEKMSELLSSEINYLKIDKNTLNKNVKMYYTKTFEEYDELLTKNIVFIDLFDAASNNTIVECIIRNTPIIVNKVGGVSEYLGNNYPLYFDDIKNISHLLTVEKITESHNYLLNMNKDDLSFEYFLKKLNTDIYQNI